MMALAALWAALRRYAVPALIVVAALAGYRAGVVLTQAAQARAVAAEQARALAQTVKLKQDVEKVANEFETERAALVDRAASADLALQRLRASIIRAGGAAQPASGGYGAAVARAVLGDCAAELRRVAGAADGYRAQLVTLQAYVRATMGD